MVSIVAGTTIVTAGLPAAAAAADDRRACSGADPAGRPAVQLYRGTVPPLATIGGVSISGGGYGSALVPAPGSPGRFFGLTDRGPNVYGPDGEAASNIKVEPLPEFAPSIGLFRFTRDGRAVRERSIPLRDRNGEPYSGRINTMARTGETILGLDGVPLAADVNGYDPEGLVAAADGTFWVADEYGPFVTRFDAGGREIARLSPLDGTLPRELANRKPNRGLEGLTITRDGSTLVGITQSGLRQPDLAVPPAEVAMTRIVTYHLATGRTREYLYPLDDPKTTTSVASEIAALPDDTFLVMERDERYPPTSRKALWKIDLRGATDVGPAARIAGASYDAAEGGLIIGGGTIEALVGDQDTATATATLAKLGVTPVAKRRFLDINSLLVSVDPTGGFFSHDKLEGLAVLDGGRKVVISNDSDFGIDGVRATAPPFQLYAKVSPVTGARDDGEFLLIDLTRRHCRRG